MLPEHHQQPAIKLGKRISGNFENNFQINYSLLQENEVSQVSFNPCQYTENNKVYVFDKVS